MGFLAAITSSILAPRASGDPTDERYWTRYLAAALSSTGLVVTPRQALQVSAIFQAVRLIAETIGALPLIVYREDEDGDKHRAKDHQLWTTLRRRPNAWQTAQQFRETMTALALIYPGSHAEIRPDADGPVGELIPFEPSTVTVEQLRGSKRLRFIIREPGEPERVLVQDQVFRINGLGISTLPVAENVILLAREAVGLWLAQEKFSGLFFGQGARPSVWMQVPKKLSDDAFKRLQEQSQARYAGLQNMHKIGLAEEGSTIKEVGWSAKDSQLTEAREAQVLEIARWFNIPEHMLRAGKSPTYASIYQNAQEFKDYTLTPWAVRWEQSALRDLIYEDDVYIEHLFDGLLRGNVTERAQAQAIYVTNGVMTRNEVRRQENLNRLDGLDEPLTPLNMERTGAPPPAGDPQPDPPPPSRQPPPVEPDEDDASTATPPAAAAPPPSVATPPPVAAIPRRLTLITEAAAARVVRKEVEQLRASAAKLAGKPGPWGEWLFGFYEKHAALVADALQLEPAVAAGYCKVNRDLVACDGECAINAIDSAAVRTLTNLALGGNLEPAHV